MKIRFYRSSDREALQSYQLTDLRFSSHPKETVADLANRYAIVGHVEHQIVTFLLLDAGEEKYTYGGQPESLLLRSFSTDEGFQMRGYGSQTLKLLPGFVRGHLPMYKSIILGVNERNQVASYLYRETGFSKQPQRILGTAGWQEVYELKI
ncbi:acetyltransferase [Streptococcus gordonii]|uniref:acetyltransferase n=1 Tax=Streptococcus gordonii TaxID=1302 RepID=UPI001EDE809D|nr:acetyltransferase [Streptococcus gordonii]MCG4821756.1 acetyltransferase [Streptococcus gordonii]MCG4847114.1 acetyltransferase [Streptococcus gordonii]MDE8686532.1 acetyltransferase [Streptococcus gordonii]